MHGAAAFGGAQRRGLGEAGGDPRDAPRQQPVGAAEHGVLLVDHGREAELRRRQHRRHRGIAAEPDHRRRGRRRAQQAARLHDPERHLGDAARGCDRSAAEPAGPDLRRLDPRHRLGKGVGPPVGQQMHRAAAPRPVARPAPAAGNRWPPVPPAASTKRSPAGALTPRSRRGAAGSGPASSPCRAPAPASTSRHRTGTAGSCPWSGSGAAPRPC